jgi:nicotinamide riboside transporter PnuC
VTSLWVLPWLMTSLALLSTWLLGKKRVSGWPVGLLAQPISLFYDAWTRQWGFIPALLVLTVLQIRAWRTWSDESRR